MKEAITATLGEVVNYNRAGKSSRPGDGQGHLQGQGEGILPGRGQAARHARQHLRPAPGARPKNIGDDTYYVTQGRNYLYERVSRSRSTSWRRQQRNTTGQEMSVFDIDQKGSNRSPMKPD